MTAHPEAAKQDRYTRWDDLQTVSFAIVQRVLLALVALALVVLSCMALWNTVVLVHAQLSSHDLTKAITTGVDTVFLTVILLELMHTVIGRGHLAQRIQEFIVIGITSAIRHGLSLVATSGSGQTVARTINHRVYQVTVPGISNPRDTVINLVINSGSVLLLVAALWLIQHRFGSKGGSDKAGSSLDEE